MKLPLKDAIEQMVDNRFSRLLIERNLPGGAALLNEQKNTGPVLKNLNGLFNDR
jgi:hypothetical protein